MKNVVIVGGGTGTYVVTNLLKNKEDLFITKVVTAFDNGGSSGRLRDEFGFIPVGDLRQSLAALAKENGQSWIRDVLLYRFQKGEGLVGHNLGNLILTALQDMTGSTPQALEIAAKIFRLKGRIYPVTTGHSELVTLYKDGSQITGEHELDEPRNGGKPIKKIKLSKPCKMYSKAQEAIKEADYIIFGPGDLYSSILPNLIVSGAKEVFADTSAKLIYVVNLMTRYTQTHGMSAQDHVNEMETYVGKPMNYVIVNSGQIKPSMKKRYAESQEYPVIDDLLKTNHTQIIRGDFASTVPVKKHPSDVLPRSLMRHDQQALGKALLNILQ